MMKKILLEYKGEKHIFETHGKMTFKEWMHGNLSTFLEDPNVDIYISRRYGQQGCGYPSKHWGDAPMNDSSCDTYIVQISFKQRPNSQKETPAMSTSKKSEQHIHLIYGVDILTASKLELMALATEICDKIDSLRATAARVPSSYITKQIEAQQELLAKVVAKLDE